MAHAVGLDFGGNLIRLCQVEYSSKGYKILHLRQHKRISSSPEHTKETLTLLFQGIPKDRVFVGISSENSIFRTLNVPFSDPEQIRKIVKFEAESHIHSCPIEKILIDFHLIEEAVRPQILIAGVLKEDLKPLLEVLHSLRIYPVSVDLDVNALLNTLTGLEFVALDESYVLLEIGLENSKILMLDQGKLLQVRLLRFGFASLQDSTSKNSKNSKKNINEKNSSPKTSILEDFSPFRLPQSPFLLSLPLLVPDEALNSEEEELLQKIQQEFEKELQFSKIEDLLHKIVKETSRTLAALSFKKTPEKVFVYCSQSESIPNAQAFFKKSFQMEVFFPDLFQKIPHQLPEEALQIPLPVALGSAFRNKSTSSIKMNFLQEEFIQIDHLRLLQKPLLLFLSLLILLFLSAGLFWKIRNTRTLKTFHTLNQQALTYLKKWNSSKIEQVSSLPPEKQVFMAKRYISHIIEEKLLSSPKDPAGLLSTFPLWRSLFTQISSIRKDLSFLHLTFLLINQSEIRFEGKVGQKEEVQWIIDALKNTKIFENTLLDGPVQNISGKVPFKLRIRFPEKK